MQPTRRPNRLSPFRRALAAAVAGPALGLLAASSAYAQYQVPNDGGARDANNRVGSGGRNAGSPSSYGNMNVTANQITYGNVTGGREFRGPVGSTDARAFRGNTAGVASDRFVRGSVGGYDAATLAGNPNLNPQAYYGDSRGVAPPPNYISPVTTFGTGQSQVTGPTNQLNAANLGGFQTGEGLVPRLGTTTTVIGGPPNPDTGATGSFLVLTPLSGIRTVSPDQVGQYTIRGSQLVPNGTAGDRFRTDGVVNRMRDELTADPAQGNPNAPGNANPGGPGAGPNGGPPQPGVVRPLGQPMQPALETPVTPNLGAGSQLNNAVGDGGQPLGSSPNTGQSVRRRLATPGQQSTVYKELQERLRRTQGRGPMTDQEAQRQFQADVRASTRPAAVPHNPGGLPPVPGVPPTVPDAPGVPAAPPPASGPAAAAPRPDPVAVSSLATGVTSPTLAQVLRQAEEQMRAGKFAAALDQYAAAQQAAPNNPLVFLGRAHAELGASSYRTAEGHLRQALLGDQALLMGKYDLRAMLGGDRVDLLVRDLKDVAAKEPADPMAPFLLGYIAYHTGNPADAALQLAEAERRQGGTDPAVRLMRQRWNLAGDGAQNK